MTGRFRATASWGAPCGPTVEQLGAIRRRKRPAREAQRMRPSTVLHLTGWIGVMLTSGSSETTILIDRNGARPPGMEREPLVAQHLACIVSVSAPQCRKSVLPIETTVWFMDQVLRFYTLQFTALQSTNVGNRSPSATQCSKLRQLPNLRSR